MKNFLFEFTASHFENALGALSELEIMGDENQGRADLLVHTEKQVDF